MKSPGELAARLARQWENPAVRELRLLRPDQWPVSLQIGAPVSSSILTDLNSVRDHVAAWRSVRIGEVRWEEKRYRGVSDLVTVPILWQLHRPSEWVAAASDRAIQLQFRHLESVVAECDERFHALLVRRLSWVLERSADEVASVGRLALALRPGAAGGRPLRALGHPGVDSKFIERHRSLLVAMLDVLHNGEVSSRGLEAFLDASSSDDHWLMLADLSGALLPFAQCRVPARSLMTAPLPADHILIVENEQCLHALPRAPGTIAILGAGLNLKWMQASWLSDRHVAYWGDVDTWGLSMLATARQYQPRLTALLMTEELFDSLAERYAVVEPTTMPFQSDMQLSQDEALLYQTLLASGRGRLEQEFIPPDRVERAVLDWVGKNSVDRLQ
ncbi:Wadjet anti-phage system protein JetD domain-containing protein [Allohahella marinimesophila]|uniref:DUF2220 family protein n=1 Tax=Allohahella marinimesophila TaxID=1054972 RepID=A0ABP7Q3T4_9GAMM